MATESAGKSSPSISDYFSAAELRLDRWSALRELLQSLAATRGEGKHGTREIAAAGEIFDALRPVERYWAFPGKSVFEALRRQLDNRAFGELSHSVGRICRALSTGAYRRRTISLSTDDSESDDVDDSSTPIDARSLTRPYFEVLIVDDVNEQHQLQHSSRSGPARPYPEIRNRSADPEKISQSRRQ